MHFKWILKCIENKKNTLVEKPAVMNIFEINEIKKLLKKQNIFFLKPLCTDILHILLN